MTALGYLETVRRLGLPMLIVVSNDDGFGAEVNALSNLGRPGPLLLDCRVNQAVRAA